MITFTGRYKSAYPRLLVYLFGNKAIKMEKRILNRTVTSRGSETFLRLYR